MSEDAQGNSVEGSRRAPGRSRWHEACALG